MIVNLDLPTLSALQKNSSRKRQLVVIGLVLRERVGDERREGLAWVE